MSSLVLPSDVSNLTVEGCVLELVKNSLKRKASRVAVRFDPKSRRVQVVDNGEGLSRHYLGGIFEPAQGKITIFERLRRQSNAVVVTSRLQASAHTYVRVANSSGRQRLFEGYHRPSRGTTVTLYDFKPPHPGWASEPTGQNSAVTYVLAALALTELQVSFSLRNDQQQRLLLNVARPHSPWEVLKCINDWPNEREESSRQNDDVSGCVISSSRPELTLRSFALSLLEGSTDEEDRAEARPSFTPLSEWSDWSYKLSLRGGSDPSARDERLFSSTAKVDFIDDAFVNLSQLSVWSDWSYQPQCARNALCDKFSNCRLNERNSRATFKYPKLNYADARGEKKFVECRLTINTVNSLQILKQINKEFIAAITNENGKKLLILIDQHAIHERIRYEWLIETYRDDKSKKFFAQRLREDLLISDIDSYLLKLLFQYKHVLARVGIRLNSVVDSNSCTVNAVPKCFVKKVKNYSNDQNMYRLTKNVRQLLIEVANGLAVSTSVLPPILPIAINNVIATEACHGSIKFGDPLNVQECMILVKVLQDTKAPTRCAHGRPSMVPLLDLADLHKRKARAKTKLNFDNLKQQVKS